MSETHEQLKTEAYRLAEEIRDGRWQHISDLSRMPAPACIELINELQQRCPGFSVAEYRRALADGLLESR